MHEDSKALLMADVPLVRAAMTAHGNVPGVAEAGLWCLLNLAAHVYNSEALMAEVPLVRAALSAHGDVVGVVEAGLGCLCMLASNADNTAALLAEVPLVCACAGPHIGVAAVASACTQFFGSLAHDEALRPGLRAAGVAGVVSTAAAVIPHWIQRAFLGWLQ